MMGPVYVITDPEASLPVVEQARAAARGGASIVQVRDKHCRDDEFLALVLMLLPEMTAHGVTLIVNDRVDLAIAAGAHGVHIGQDDGDPAAVRARLPEGMLLGLSVFTETQVRAVPAGVDYLGAGPIRPTATKPNHAPPIGFDGLARIASAAAIPTYAIGGLMHGDAVAVRRSGAVGMAVVSAITRAADPMAATRALVDEWWAS